MTTDPTAFNELGQILAEGGEQALARLISQGATEERIALLFFTRFEPMRDFARESLRVLANSMAAAGDILSGLDPFGSFNLGIIPVNEFLFADDPGGRRMRVAFEIELEDFGRRISVLVDFPDVPTLTDLFDAAQLELMDRATKSPGAFGLQPGDLPAIKNLIIPFAERRF